MTVGERNETGFVHRHAYRHVGRHVHSIYAANPAGTLLGAIGVLTYNQPAIYYAVSIPPNLP